MMAADMDATTEAPRLADAFPEARRLGDLLRRRGLHVAVAESCTGGLLGAALTAVAGSSDYMLGGIVAYADAVKLAQLGIDEALLRAHGAVSEEVARAMATGVRERLQADMGLAITGVAGPSASAGKPAGLIWIAVAGPAFDSGALRTRRLDGDRGREANRAAAVRAVLELAEAAVAAAVGGA
jgi:PncC family amidohydrolase